MLVFVVSKRAWLAPNSLLVAGGVADSTAFYSRQYPEMPLSTEEYDKLSPEEREEYDKGERERERQEQAGEWPIIRRDGIDPY